MSNAVISVAPDASLRTVCRTLVDGGVHRAFVTDRGKLVGVVSAMDIIQLLTGRG
jgi:CBS domain-containing protein